MLVNKKVALVIGSCVVACAVILWALLFALGALSDVWYW